MIQQCTEDRRHCRTARLSESASSTTQLAQRWDANRYYTDPNYYNDPKLVRPYVVGMSCGFCHVSFNPVKPPDDPEKPKWENLSSTIGNQYFNASRVFGNGATADSYAYQLFHSWPRGTVDTSFLATDNLNNPSKMNPIFAIPARMTVAHEEDITGGALNFPGEQSRMAVPHVLKDGADSVGTRRRVEPRLRQHRRIQPAVAARPQRDRRRQTATAVQRRQGAEELRLLAGDGGTRAEPGEVPDEDEWPEARGRARRKSIPHAG